MKKSDKYRNRLPDRGDCTENNPNVYLHRYIQKHQKIGGTVTHSSNCLEPEKIVENVKSDECYRLYDHLMTA